MFRPYTKRTWSERAEQNKPIFILVIVPAQAFVMLPVQIGKQYKQNIYIFYRVATHRPHKYWWCILFVYTRHRIDFYAFWMAAANNKSNIESNEQSIKSVAQHLRVQVRAFHIVDDCCCTISSREIEEMQRRRVSRGAGLCTHMKTTYKKPRFVAQCAQHFSQQHRVLHTAKYLPI